MANYSSDPQVSIQAAFPSKVPFFTEENQANMSGWNVDVFWIIIKV